ncbi:MAG: hypothetical protein M1827_003574 [Pycnora praestabilis]|nr:MAG: hypothetical protein M1827_003574 [Pycnora praestabilis]
MSEPELTAPVSEPPETSTQPIVYRSSAFSNPYTANLIEEQSKDDGFVSRFQLHCNVAAAQKAAPREARPPCQVRLDHRQADSWVASTAEEPQSPFEISSAAREAQLTYAEIVAIEDAELERAIELSLLPEDHQAVMNEALSHTMPSRAPQLHDPDLTDAHVAERITRGRERGTTEFNTRMNKHLEQQHRPLIPRPQPRRLVVRPADVPSPEHSIFALPHGRANSNRASNVGTVRLAPPYVPRSDNTVGERSLAIRRAGATEREIDVEFPPISPHVESPFITTPLSIPSSETVFDPPEGDTSTNHPAETFETNSEQASNGLDEDYLHSGSSSFPIARSNSSEGTLAFEEMRGEPSTPPPCPRAPDPPFIGPPPRPSPFHRSPSAILSLRPQYQVTDDFIVTPRSLPLLNAMVNFLVDRHWNVPRLGPEGIARVYDSLTIQDGVRFLYFLRAHDYDVQILLGVVHPRVVFRTRMVGQVYDHQTLLCGGVRGVSADELEAGARDDLGNGQEESAGPGWGEIVY